MNKRSASEEITRDSFEKLYGATVEEAEATLPPTNNNRKRTKKESNNNEDLNSFSNVTPFIQLYGLSPSEQQEMQDAYDKCDGSQPMTRQRKSILLNNNTNKVTVAKPAGPKKKCAKPNTASRSSKSTTTYDSTYFCGI